MKKAHLAIGIMALSLVSHVRSENQTYRRAEMEAAPMFESAIRDAKEITLLVFDPHSRFDKKKPGDRVFESSGISGSWLIAKELTIKDRAKQALLGTSLRAGIEQFDDGVPACFEPRHGIRVIVGGKEVTFMICFQCSQAYVNGFPKCSGFLVNPKAGSIWDGVFQDCGLKTIR